MSLGEKVAQLRASRGWTLKQLSERCAISVSHLNAIEKGDRRQPAFQLVVRLADAFGIPVTYFQDGESAGTALIGLEIARMYDSETARFIANERSLPYVQFAKQLAEQAGNDLPLDAPSVLQAIAEFIKEHKARY